MRIERVDLHHIELPMVRPYVTVFEHTVARPKLLVAVHAEGLTGWGECVASNWPGFSYETIETAWHVLRDFLIPAVLGQEVASPDDVLPHLHKVRGHPMAKAALECAIWDVVAQARAVPLASLLGGHKDQVIVGAAVGLEATQEVLLEQVDLCVKAGYCRVKLKIKPGWDIDIIRAVRERWPELPLQVDANASYTLDDLPVLRELDQLGLLLIEQPLHHQDIVDHARLQAQLETPVSLDESIISPEHARWALEIGACRNINIKLCRVGGLAAALQIHDLCADRGVPVWCGGMGETNIGRAINVALASLPNFALSNDIGASARYFQQDIAEPGFVLGDNSTLVVPTEPGLGVQVDLTRVAAARLRHLTLPA